MKEVENQKKWFIKWVESLQDDKLKARVFFLLLSLILWFIIKLSKDGYRDTVEFKVNYINQMSSKEIVNTPPSSILLEIKAQGFDILRYNLFGAPTLDIDLNYTSPVNDLFYWHTVSNKSLLENQIIKEVEILSAKPDTIYFDFSQLYSKKVPVKLQLKKEFKNSLSIGSIKIEPDSVVVQLPKSQFSEIDSVWTDEFVITGEKLEMSEKLEIIFPDISSLHHKVEELQLDLNLIELTQGSFSFKPQILNLPDSMSMITYPREVKLIFNVGVDKFKNVVPQDFNLFVDFDDITTNSESNPLSVQIGNYPSFIDYVDYEPKRLEYILIQK